jgi:mono/diheme cytochrome c family protein
MRTKFFVTPRVSLPLAAALATTLLGCDVTVEDGNDDSDTADIDETDIEGARASSWDIVRAARQRVLDRYLAEHAADRDAFLNNTLGLSGIPRPLFNGFSAAYPEIWGGPGVFLQPQGFHANPFNPSATLPLGLGSTVANGVEVVGVSCGGCHTGRVLGPRGNVITLIGAPNTGFNALRAAVEDTAADPNFFAKFGENPLTTAFRTRALQARNLLVNTMVAFTYNPLRFPNAPDIFGRDKPGFLDPIGVAMSIVTLPDLLDPAKAQQVVTSVMGTMPAQVDIVSVWRQSARPVAQWDGSILNPTYRNLAASLGVIGDPALVDFANAHRAAEFTANLPPPPYPFDVDIRKALAGKPLYDRYCGSCHKDGGNPTIFAASRVGTDPGRTTSITNEGRRRLILALRASCKDPAVCDIPDEQIIRDFDATGRGYVAAPLDGIWARAPYLHNGAVPTLYHLLMPNERPAAFLRGNIRYDDKKVGFVWDIRDTAAANEINVHVFDTTEAGGSNAGHSNAEFNGLDWSRFPRERDQLLEYMKTL